MNNENLAAEIGQMIHNPTDQLHPNTVHETLVVGDMRGRATPVKEEPKLEVKEEPKLEVKEEKTMDARWEPVKAAPCFIDRLKTAACSVAKPAVLGLFFFWCQQCQKMDSTTAVCAMFVCVAVAAFHMGRLFYAGE